MKLAIALLIALSSPAFCKWRPVKVSSITDSQSITENFRRASLWSNRKLDRFSNDTLYGQPIFQNGIKFGDGTIQNTAVISTLSYVLKAGDTMTGKLIVSSSVYITGNTGIGSDTPNANFPGARLVVSKGVTGHTYAANIGGVGEAVADVGAPAIGWGGVSKTNGIFPGYGVAGRALVGTASDSGAAVGIEGLSEATHSGGSNIGVYSIASGGLLNYSFYGNAGNIYNNGDIQGTSISVKTGATKTTFVTGTQDSNITYVLPLSTSGIASGGKMLQIDANGNLSWQDPPITGQQAYYFTDTSDIAPYRLMTSSVASVSAVAASTVVASASDIIISTYITPIGYPPSLLIPAGEWTIHNHGYVSAVTGAKVVRVYSKIFIYRGGSEILIGQTEFSEPLGAVLADFEIHLSTGEIVLTAGDRIVVRSYTSVSGSGTNPSLYLYIMNNYFSRLRLPAPAVDVTNFVPYSGATNSVNLGDNNITAANFYGSGASLTGVIPSSATGYYGIRVATSTYLATAPGACSAGQFISALTADGTKTCGTPAGSGDAVLSATQTFTGSNTFTGAVSVSSISATGYAAFTSVTSTITFSGWIDVARVEVTSTPVSSLIVNAVCPSGYKVLGGGGYCNSGNTSPLYSAPNDSGGIGYWNVFQTKCAGSTNNYSSAICARIK